MPQAGMPDKFLAWSGLWHTWHKWVFETNVSAVQACLAFPLSYPEIDRVVVGVDSQNQLMQIVSDAESNLTSNLPNLECDDEKLINPSNWGQL
jgi:aryl-alcohol dehydrogenase-like predicted oxidoreductase